MVPGGAKHLLIVLCNLYKTPDTTTWESSEVNRLAQGHSGSRRDPESTTPPWMSESKLSKS